MKTRLTLAALAALASLFSRPAILTAGLPHVPDRAPEGAENVRFQFLSPTLLRMEFSPGAKFADAPTVVVQNRTLFRAGKWSRQESGWLVDSSEHITVRYKLGSGRFTRDNLRVSWTSGGMSGTWSPGEEDTLNLGSVATLDGVSGNRLPPPGKGVLSRSGYFMLDDSMTPLADSGWVAPRNERGNQDLYLLMYGRDYTRALKEFSRLCGKIPLLPRYAYGVWMTDLNYEYTPGSDLVTKFPFHDGDLKSRIERFRGLGLPLDVLVLDFAWHKFGWQGGYDWSPLFRDPAAFLAWCHETGLHVGVNDHPKTRGESALSGSDSHAAEARRMLGRPSGGKAKFVLNIPERWRFRTDPSDTGMLASWYSTGFQDSTWELLDAGKPWQDQGHPGHIGLGWYRKWVDVPAGSPKRLYLVLGGAADQYDLFVNGRSVAGHISSGNRLLNTLTCTDVSEAMERGERNLIALRINSWADYGGLTALPVQIADAVPPGLLEFTLTDRREADAFMRALHAPVMKDGIDFWWIDGTGPCPVLGLNSQLWTNKIYYDFTRKLTGQRSLILSRYAGWGSQRYPAVATGDTYSEWPMLAYQVGASARAGNVLAPYASDDIGGFHGDTLSAGLYCRWLEFGAFSPILRLHCAHENPSIGNLRMPWVYGEEGIRTARRFFNLREQLLPYIYTLGRTAHDEGLPLLRPLYLQEPGLAEAYAHPGEYFFGDAFLVSPVTDSSNKAATYLPPGKWIGYFDGKRYTGGETVTGEYSLDSMPLFVRSGSIIPMQPARGSAGRSAGDTLILAVYGPEAGKFSLYEDDGVSTEYEHGRCSWTEISTHAESGFHVTIGLARGQYGGQRPRRAWILQIHGLGKPGKVSVDGRVLERGNRKGTWSWDPESSTVQISLPARDIRTATEVAVR